MTKLELRHELETSYTYKAPRVAGIAYQLRIIYFYGPVHPWSEPKYAMENLKEGVRYRAFFFDPRTAQEYPVGIIKTNENGQWQIPTLGTGIGKHRRNIAISKRRRKYKDTIVSTKCTSYEKNITKNKAKNLPLNSELFKNFRKI